LTASTPRRPNCAHCGEAAANPELAALTAEAPRPGIVDVPEQWLVLVTCRDEKQQVELLEGFRREGVECRALVA